MAQLLPFLWWLIDWIGDLALAALATLWVIGHGQSADAEHPVQAPVSRTEQQASITRRNSGSESRIEARISDSNRCLVVVHVNGRGPLEFIADSGAPDPWLPVGDLPKIGIARSSLSFSWFGPRERKVAWVNLPELRIGDFVAHDVRAAISEGEDMRLLGMSVLKQGHMEIEGDHCVLTFPRNAAVQSVAVDKPRRATRQVARMAPVNGPVQSQWSPSTSSWCTGTATLPPVPGACAAVTSGRLNDGMN
jgi:predicted aspartyl protease